MTINLGKNGANDYPWLNFVVIGAAYRGDNLLESIKKKHLILVVDHHIDDLRGLGKSLKGLGEIIFATSAEVGLFLADQRQPDLIIANGAMPTMAGPDLCKRLKLSRKTAHCAVILVGEQESSSTSPNELESSQFKPSQLELNHPRDPHLEPDRIEVSSLEAGAVDFIRKPYREEVLRARIKTHLNLYQQHSLLQILADRDGLTEVYNRRYFDCQGRIELKRHYRQQQPMTLALIDIDHFKSYNDVYGHLQGDACLREVAQALVQNSRRPAEFVARYGGEEFAVILPNTHSRDARKYGQWICEQIHNLAIPHGTSPTLPFITISAGIATTIPTGQTSLDHLIATADSALYIAKEAGRNQFAVAQLERDTIRETG